MSHKQGVERLYRAESPLPRGFDRNNICNPSANDGGHQSTSTQLLQAMKTAFNARDHEIRGSIHEFVIGLRTSGLFVRTRTVDDWRAAEMGCRAFPFN